MILKKLTTNHFGPFSSPTVLEVSSNTTVITGANDSGKSSILRLITQIFGGKRDIQKREYNISKLAKSGNSWDQDSQWYCDAEFEVPSDFQERLNSLIDLLRLGSKNSDEEVRMSIPLMSGDKITLRYYLASQHYVLATTWGYKPIQVNGKQPDTIQLAALSDHNLHLFLPTVVSIPHDNGFALYNTDVQLTDLTNDLLNIAFEKRGFLGDDLN